VEPPKLAFPFLMMAVIASCAVMISPQLVHNFIVLENTSFCFRKQFMHDKHPCSVNNHKGTD
jgi:hypothetical protein